MILTFWRLIYQVSYCGWFLMNTSSQLRMTVFASLLAALMAAGAYLSIPNRAGTDPFAEYVRPSGRSSAGKPVGARRRCRIFSDRRVCGLPVFAGGLGGIGRIVGPTGGYLIGYLPAVVKISLNFQQSNTPWRLCPSRAQRIWVPEIPEPRMTRLLWTIGYWLNKFGRIFRPNPAEPEPNRFSLSDLLRICMKLFGMLEWVSSAVGIDPPCGLPQKA